MLAPCPQGPRKGKLEFTAVLEKLDRNNGLLQKVYKPWATRRFAIEVGSTIAAYYRCNTGELRGTFDISNSRIEEIDSSDPRVEGKHPYPFQIVLDKTFEIVLLAASTNELRQCCINVFQVISKHEKIWTADDISPYLLKENEKQAKKTKEENKEEMVVQPTSSTPVPVAIATTVTTAPDEDPIKDIAEINAVQTAIALNYTDQHILGANVAALPSSSTTQQAPIPGPPKQLGLCTFCATCGAICCITTVVSGSSIVFLVFTILALVRTSYSEQQDECSTSQVWIFLLVHILSGIILSCACRSTRKNANQASASSESQQASTSQPSSPTSTTTRGVSCDIRSCAMIGLLVWGLYELFGVSCVQSLKGTLLYTMLQVTVALDIIGVVTTIGLIIGLRALITRYFPNAKATTATDGQDKRNIVISV